MLLVQSLGLGMLLVGLAGAGVSWGWAALIALGVNTVAAATALWAAS